MQNFTPPNVGKFTPKKLGIAAAVILGLIILGTSVFIVDPAERAVMTRFGRFIGTRDPGLHFKLPFGIDRNHNVNVRTIQEETFGTRPAARGGTVRHIDQINEATMLTGDLNIVDVEWIIQFLVNDPFAWIFNVNDPVFTIRDVSRSVINMLVGDRAIMDIIGGERSRINHEAAILMNEIFKGYGLGIDVIAVILQNVVPPQGVQAAFQDVNMAMQDRERLINEGQQMYNEEIPRVRGEVQRIIHVAEGYAAERVNMARGNVARFNAVFEEYQRAPEVTRQRLYLEMMEEVFGQREGVTLIDRNLSNFLPLMNMGSAAPGGAR